jgi:HSP20 family molecular chaperone IbpA
MFSVKVPVPGISSTSSTGVYMRGDILFVVVTLQKDDSCVESYRDETNKWQEEVLEDKESTMCKFAKQIEFKSNLAVDQLKVSFKPGLFTVTIPTKELRLLPVELVSENDA